MGNVEFRLGYLEDIPLPDAAVDVVISNCVFTLSTDKPRALAEAARVLRPGGRFGISDVLAEPGLDPARRAEAEHAVGCPVGTLTAAQYRDQLLAAGFATTAIIPTHALTGGLYSAIVQATTPRSDHDRNSVNLIRERPVLHLRLPTVAFLYLGAWMLIALAMLTWAAHPDRQCTCGEMTDASTRRFFLSRPCFGASRRPGRRRHEHLGGNAEAARPATPRLVECLLTCTDLSFGRGPRSRVRWRSVGAELVRVGPCRAESRVDERRRLAEIIERTGVADRRAS